MKAVVYHKYGSTENLRVEEVPRPSPKKGQVLVKVHFSSVNSWDWDLVLGQPYIVRIEGWFKPAFQILGADIAGEVVETGDGVEQFQVGERVFGDLSTSGWGGFGEFVAVDSKVLAKIPENVSFADAAAIPQAGVLALQGLTSHFLPKEGQKLLINGAGGGVGTYCLQLAKLKGMEVTVVDRADKLEMLSNLGADYQLDYRETNYTRQGKSYDLIIDVTASQPINNYVRCLNKNGRFVMVGGHLPLLIPLLLKSPWYRSINKKHLAILVHKPNSMDLDMLARYMAEGQIKSIIDSICPLDETPYAIQKLGNGNVNGKILIQLSS